MLYNCQDCFLEGGIDLPVRDNSPDVFQNDQFKDTSNTKMTFLHDKGLYCV